MLNLSTDSTMENNTVLLGKLLILSVLTAAASFAMMMLVTSLYVALIPTAIFCLLILLLFRKPIRSLSPVKGIGLLFIASFAVMLLTAVIAAIFPLEGISSGSGVMSYLVNFLRIVGAGIVMAAVLEIIIYFSGSRKDTTSGRNTTLTA